MLDTLDAVSSSVWDRRPASTTQKPAPASVRLTARPMPLPAPVTTATFPLQFCNRSAFHHEFDFAQGGDVPGRIALHRNQVGEHSLLHESDLHMQYATRY